MEDADGLNKPGGGRDLFVECRFSFCYGFLTLGVPAQVHLFLIVNWKIGIPASEEYKGLKINRHHLCTQKISLRGLSRRQLF